MVYTCYPRNLPLSLSPADTWVQAHPEHALHDNVAIAVAIIATFDTDGDGDIDGEELDRAVEYLDVLATVASIKKHKHHDTNGDGEVDVEELKAAVLLLKW